MNKLKFIVDECIGSLIAKWLTSIGYDVISIATEMRSSTDLTILNKAFSENRIIITNDKDFGDLVFHQKIQHAGIILMRLQNGSSENKVKVLENLLLNYSNHLAYNFIVVSEANIRIIKQIVH